MRAPRTPPGLRVQRPWRSPSLRPGISSAFAALQPRRRSGISRRRLGGSFCRRRRRRAPAAA
eukprot:5143040-Alexandrium_andersonii.AAC.1